MGKFVVVCQDEKGIVTKVFSVKDWNDGLKKVQEIWENLYKEHLPIEEIDMLMGALNPVDSLFRRKHASAKLIKFINELMRH